MPYWNLHRLKESNASGVTNADITRGITTRAKEDKRDIMLAVGRSRPTERYVEGVGWVKEEWTREGTTAT